MALRAGDRRRIRDRGWPGKRPGDVRDEHRGQRLPDPTERAWNVPGGVRQPYLGNRPGREKPRRRDLETARRAWPVSQGTWADREWIA